MTAHDHLIKSLHTFVAPVPWPKRRRRSHVYFFGGGWLFWILIGWVIFFGYLLWWMAILMYVLVLFTARFYYILGTLCWWGIDSGVGVIQRRGHHDPLKDRPPPPTRLAA